ncbi:hypothetical protein CEXT_573631 [Caerostris extrusa]|uniref:Uncharacterized protein n=1 Tax=Caerostris extrusa TaxID=172846 RepID=A0AAV4SD44_CAEEX|nr:hypothetical protein CEXT_573631 [Caerostris extrusa]
MELSKALNPTLTNQPAITFWLANHDNYVPAMNNSFIFSFHNEFSAPLCKPGHPVPPRRQQRIIQESYTLRKCKNSHKRVS